MEHQAKQVSVDERTPLYEELAGLLVVLATGRGEKLGRWAKGKKWSPIVLLFPQNRHAAHFRRIAFPGDLVW